ncbi:MAG TPA: sugar ABC transporter permease [Gaiellaceae bacterium]|nr:sugar ABC transporter permease [Gaiellaceae bacterium]
MAVAAERARRLPSVGSESVREAAVGYAFVLVPLFVFALFYLYPLVYAFYVSAHEWGGLEGKIGYVGLDNYRELRGDTAFWTWPPERATALWNTVYYTALVVPVQMALGLLMALVVNQPIRGRTFFRSAYYFPALTSSAAISAIALYLLNADGLVNAAIGAVLGHDFNHPWFGDPDTALESIVGLNAWTTSGTMMLFYLAALQSIPTDVYEAAAIDKAGAWRTFWKITFPLLKPAHFFVAVVSVIGALKLFDQAFIISSGAGGPAGSTMTAVLYLYRVTISEFNYGYGAAIGVVLFLIIFTLTLVQRLLFGKAEIGY